MNHFLIVLLSICSHESRGDVHAINITDGGSASYGFCQIKFKTAKALGFRGSIQELWHNPQVNMGWAGRYLKKQLGRYDNNYYLAVAAYNAGSVKKKNYEVIKNAEYYKGNNKHIIYVKEVFKKVKQMESNK